LFQSFSVSEFPTFAEASVGEAGFRFQVPNSMFKVQDSRFKILCQPNPPTGREGWVSGFVTGNQTPDAGRRKPEAGSRNLIV